MGATWSGRRQIDDMAVYLAVGAEPVGRRLTVGETRAAAARLDARGWSASRIAEHLGVSERSVVRYRRERRVLH